ncbi:hypothetical protein H4Q26_001194 [Puccinia striiformis f. sp. tritici PST-130]|nr:hypothetical protein H4Q26_001194 [Puccinia striiformis f. sp. tritici PST-130]
MISSAFLPEDEHQPLGYYGIWELMRRGLATEQSIDWFCRSAVTWGVTFEIRTCSRCGVALQKFRLECDGLGAYTQSQGLTRRSTESTKAANSSITQRKHWHPAFIPILTTTPLIWNQHRGGNMDEYDEWGNFIGDLSDDSDKGSEANDDDRHSPIAETLAPLPEPDEMNDMEMDHVGSSNAVVLHDDKKYYPLAMELYGPDVETMVEEEDAQPLTEPIINPSKSGEAVPETTFSKQFMADLMSHPESVRNVAVVGHLHHGKTALLDMLVHETHDFEWDTSKPLLYTDTHILEQQRGISLKSSPMSFVLQNSKQKSFLVNMIDTPGHVNFLDEVTNSLRLVDGAILVVDAVEGVLVSTDKIIRHLVQEGIPIVLVVNKVDRLILELRLPPADAYYKLKHTIEEVNTVISSCNPDPIHRVSPELGNVGFASTEMGWCFNLTSFAKMYRDTFCTSKKDLFDITAFAKRLWGNIWYIPEERKFVKRNVGGECKRTLTISSWSHFYKLLRTSFRLLCDDEEDMVEALIERVFIFESRYSVETSGVPAGNLCLLSGIDNSITKTATVVESAYTRPGGSARARISTQAVGGLTKGYKTYPLVEIKVEESGEHVIIGTGEIYLDCCLFDLREIFSEIEIKVSDPVVKFCETVVDTSVIKCYAETPNKKNKLTMIAEPLEKGIAEEIETGRINIRMPAKTLSQHFMNNYQWDLLASRSIWAFGLKSMAAESIKQGFQWATREGPICDEPIRNVKFKLLDATLADEPIYRGGGQIIPTARRVCYSSFMMATPRLMEPVYYIEVQAPADCVPAVYLVLARRRGHVTQDIPKPGSPLYTVKAYIPVIDANGFETDLRTHTQGQSFCMQTFDHWSIVPGDPTDKSITLRPLEPASAQALARDVALKTRRRKGLGDNMSVAKYIEADLVAALIAAGQENLLG